MTIENRHEYVMGYIASQYWIALNVSIDSMTQIYP